MASGKLLAAEIGEQPEALARLLSNGRKRVEQVAKRIRAFGPTWVMIAARGTSDNAARYAQYLFGAHNRLGVGLAAPSLLTLYDARPRLDLALTIGISQSGQSPDILAVIEEARRQGGATLAITNDPDSPLARAAEACIPLLAGEERCVAATKTYTTELLALAMLSAALEEDGRARWERIERIPDTARAVIDATGDLSARVSAHASAEQMLVLGRGFNYCTAFEIALKIKETSYVMAEPYSVADLLHGPIAMVDEDVPVVVVAPTGRAFQEGMELMELFEQRGARLIALTDREDIIESATTVLRLPAGTPEWLSPLVAVLPGQLFAVALAMARGVDPDEPRGLSKVTRTR
jgi:glucosamine--fructose-6-phosphate aminotransferase (isomerizing)